MTTPVSKQLVHSLLCVCFLLVTDSVAAAPAIAEKELPIPADHFRLEVEPILDVRSGAFLNRYYVTANSRVRFSVRQTDSLDEAIPENYRAVTTEIGWKGKTSSDGKGPYLKRFGFPHPNMFQILLVQMSPQRQRPEYLDQVLIKYQVMAGYRPGEGGSMISGYWHVPDFSAIQRQARSREKWQLEPGDYPLGKPLTLVTLGKNSMTLTVQKLRVNR